MVQDGDPYRDEMEQCVGMIMDELSKRGWNNHYSLAYQSRVGPVGLLTLPVPSLRGEVWAASNMVMCSMSHTEDGMEGYVSVQKIRPSSDMTSWDE